jgi:hypothetical protein
MLQANLYMNAKVYIGKDHYATSFNYKITGSAYKLHTNYNQLFLADNDKKWRKMNLSLPLLLMVSVRKLWRNNILTHAPVGGSMKASEFGINGGWGGLRTTCIC